LRPILSNSAKHRSGSATLCGGGLPLSFQSHILKEAIRTSNQSVTLDWGKSNLALKNPRIEKVRAPRYNELNLTTQKVESNWKR
jgi:hypothetical protein